MTLGLIQNTDKQRTNLSKTEHYNHINSDTIPLTFNVSLTV